MSERGLPEKHTLKDINRLKKDHNWGELPAFYHMVSSAVAELESIESHGFDNALKKICNKDNWNPRLLGGRENRNFVLEFDKKPRIAIYRAFTERGYEVHCFPYARDMEVDQFVREHPLMEFKVWDPGTMRLLYRIPQLQMFIIHVFQHEDPADKALVFYAHKLAEQAIQILQERVNVVKIEGESIMEHYEKIRDQVDLHREIQLMGELRPNIMNLTDAKKDSDS